MKFLKISASFQRRIANILLAVLTVWLVATLAMVASQIGLAIERATLSSQQKSVATAAERVAAYRESIDAVADDLEKRQDILDSLWKSHFADEPAAATPPANAETQKAHQKISAQFPEARRLIDMETRQLAFVSALTAKARQRAAAARAEIRSFGLNPDMLAKQSPRAVGGPFIPFFGNGADDGKQMDDPRFARLVDTLEEMERLELMLNAIPSSMPAYPALSSGFGYRRDPFTGAGAMHAGLDFKGPHGAPIRSAADGRVTFAGVRGGYGNCVEVTHSGGIMTRYAHLSGINVKPGQKVARGAMLGKMGSTGRSTGTHLHFEVRLNGTALNPAKFLET